ncbi:hypothetical protein AGLY_011542 [Aphis glycines]|uniref:Uncharacterized protein n=1 Tax=Aphis glycines TaxID=307491 RepID=A0A6G0TCQ9_APHGL|nr:hypothetical protein AGLY_011542 [Aphis glycines]
MIATKEFSMTRNHRCQDLDYNKKIELLSNYSCDSHLDEWSYALLGAMFFKNMIQQIDKSDTLLATNHIHLSEALDKLIITDNVLREPWLIESDSSFRVYGRETEPNSNLYHPNTLLLYMQALTVVDDDRTAHVSKKTKLEPVNRYHCRGKFLSYLPLIIGQVHFVRFYSEWCLGTLVKITPNNDGDIKSVTVRMHDSESFVTLEKSSNCKNVMFDKHSHYLINSGLDTRSPKQEPGRGKLYNFPIYPAFVMSIYMCQGRTISNRVSFILTNATYQSLYVAASRITSSDNVNAIIVPNSLSILLSTIMNFDTTSGKITIEEINKKLVNGFYKYYVLPPQYLDLLYFIGECVSNSDINTRRMYRKSIFGLVEKYQIPFTIIQPKTILSDTDVTLNATLAFIIQHKITMTMLVNVDQTNRHLWIRLFLKKMFRVFFSKSELRKWTEMSDVDRPEKLSGLCTFTYQNVIVRENVDLHTFVQNNKKIVYTDQRGTLPVDRVLIDDNNNRRTLADIKPKLPYTCIGKFTYDLLHDVKLTDSQETVCDTLYKLLARELKKL